MASRLRKHLARWWRDPETRVFLFCVALLALWMTTRSA
jgi:hypothetical protein